ncbi:CCR4-Not complex component, Not1-domain-containing protein [Scheffersomyces xylosifermentans]|uniref:CCR4-Not complex component, Not1-domain-containing protein n=1 Tax=Scheffersomyces xylosifermentans TaxID=1304137 RepID=UPI00315E02B9
MSFKELLLEIGPENLLPEKLLPSLFQIKPTEVDQSIALILSEVIVPGSQGLAGLAFANTVPEANAKGAQLQACFRSLESNSAKLPVNWYEVFSHVHQNLFESAQRGIQPTVTSVTQLLSALDFKEGLIDIFLSYEWWFSKTLFSFLQAADPQQGAYDIAVSKNLSLCFEDDRDASVSQPPGVTPPHPNRNILRFVNIAKLELRVWGIVHNQQQQNQQLGEQERKLNAFLGQVFEHDFRTYPEYLVAAATTFAERTPFISDLVDKLIGQLWENDSNTGLSRAFSKLREVSPQLAVSKLIGFYTTRKSVESANRALVVASTSGLLPSVVNEAWNVDTKTGMKFLIESSLFDFDYKTLFDSKVREPQQKAAVYNALLECLEERAQRDYERGQSLAPGQQTTDGVQFLKIPFVYSFLEKLKASNGLIDAEQLKNLQLLLLTTYPRLINFGNGHDATILANAAVSNFFPADVEQEMKAYYSKMYNKEVEIKDIVDMLVRMKASDEPHQQDVFACMIHSLLDEYRFFSEYPLSALASTSLLFGALLEKDLIQGTTLTVALNFIWESCNQPQDSHLFKFAVQSLYNFKSRLHEYPIYCKHLLECRSLSAHAKMYQIVRDASNGIPCGQTVTSTPEVGPRYQSITVTEKTIGFVKQEEPPEAVSDKLLFFVNNMTGDNLRSNEIKELISEKYYAWFSNYIVVDRAKAEPNNHDMYATLVNELDDPIFFEYILNVSLREVERLIRNSKEARNERNQLKNLAAWLGKITLADDKPLRRDQIALKFLLVEAYDFKSLPLIIPFVCKILDQAQYSKVFRPPNPWVLGIIKVLVELYHTADLTLNLKFEIEVLLNAFKLKVSDIEPSTLIGSHNPNPASLAAMFGIHPETVTLANDINRLSLEAAGVSHPLGLEALPPVAGQFAAPPGQEGIPPLQPGFQDQQLVQQQQQQQQQQLHQSGESALDTSFSNLVGNSIFTQHANLRRAFQASLSRAVRECAVPILSRVSEAVLTTTEFLVNKDFATERDVTKFRKSYQNMARQLSHSMVLCSGRKLLAETIEATMLQLLGNNPKEFPIDELNAAVQANVGLCVEIVDKIAADNINELIDERMQKYVTIREQSNAAEPFVDTSSSAGTPQYALRLPEPLGLNPEGLSANQLHIYESFGTNSSAQLPQQQQEVSIGQQVTLQQEDSIPVEQLFSAITQNCEKAISLLNDVSETKLADLSPSHPIMASLTQALAIAQANAVKYPELLLKAAQYAVNCLFTQVHENPMSNEIYVVVLDKLCEYSPSTAKDVTWWLVHSSDQRKFNMPVIFSLLKVQLVQPTKLDSSIGRLITESNNPVVVKFASTLLLNVYSSQELRPIALRSEFGFTLEALSKYVADESSDDQKQAKLARDNLFELLNRTIPSPFNHLYGQLGYIFSEWVKLLTHGERSTELEEQFLKGLLEAEILTNPKYFQVFFKSAMEISVTAFATEHEVRSRTQRETYLAVDTLAMLIVRIVSQFERKEEAIDYLKKIISVILLVLANDHETAKVAWNERAYFRFFSSLLSSWSDLSTLSGNATSQLNEDFYIYIGDVFNSLQPIIYPGFTFAWVSLIAHRMFLPKLLELPEAAGYQTVVKLLTANLKFQSVYSKEVKHDVINVIFKAVNRIFAGLIHDYPEFLVGCHYQLVTAMPRGYTQLRNIILSATPANVAVPDPFTQGLKVERLPEINDSPVVAYKPVEDLAKVGLKKPVDNFLRIPAPALMRSIYGGIKLNHPKEVEDSEVIHYNVKLVNALVLHVGISAVADRLPNNRGFNTKSSQVALLVDLMNYGSSEFKFHLINAIANQLRYPNSHTHWFIGIILHFFSSNSIWGSPAAKATIQELITRVLLERRIVSKPHPWGLTIVFTELVKNGDYGFFDLPFVKDASPELKSIFDALMVNVKGSSPPAEN